MAMFVCRILSVAFLIMMNVFPLSGSQSPTNSDDLNAEPEDDLPNECLIQLNKFAEHASDFTKCVISNAQPIKVCENCTINYRQVVDSYEDIQKINTSHKENCRDILTNIDRLQVVHASYFYVQSMWKNASCALCLNDNGTDLNIQTKTIQSLEKSLKECNSTKNNNSISCVECQQPYRDFINYYEKCKNLDGFCMDIVDLVNKTQMNWGKQCHEFNGNIQWKLLIIASTALLLPILFYLSNWHSSQEAYVLLPENRYRNKIFTNNIASTSGYTVVS